MDGFRPEFLAIGLAWYVVFLFSTTVHEASHALAAKLGGDLTAFLGGQVSLDPVPHIRREPFGMVLMPIMSYLSNGWMMGWASAPYDPRWAERYPRRAALMALAGPTGNFILMLLAGAGIRIGMSLGYFTFPQDGLSMIQLVEGTRGSLWDTAAMLLSVTFNLNLLLGTFNLLPVPPLDGSSVITIVLPDALAVRWRRLLANPWLLLLGLLIAWKTFPMVFVPIRMVVLGLLFWQA